jgi:low affinity Fe/Cu permease
MDKIETSVDALSTADAILKELSDNIRAVVMTNDTAIKNQFNGVDADLQAALSEYLDDLISLSRTVVELETANRNAIRERINRVSEYSGTAYQRRNI